MPKRIMLYDNGTMARDETDAPCGCVYDRGDRGVLVQACGGTSRVVCGDCGQEFTHHHGGPDDHECRQMRARNRRAR